MDDGPHTFGPFVLDRAAGLVMRDGVPLAIGRRGVAVLAALVEAGGNVVTKDQLIDLAWPDQHVSEANLSVQVAALRKELGRTASGAEWIATVPRVGYRFAVDAIDAAQPSDRHPTLAVLPFRDLSGAVASGYFADGLVEDIITGLSRFTTFAVVSRGAAFAQRHLAADPRAAARALRVRYLLSGSLQVRGDRLRITAHLLNGETGLQLWAEQFDGDTADIFAVQDRVTETVAGFVAPGILKAEIERVRRRPPESLDAYDLYLQALPYFRGTDAATRAGAIERLEAAVRRDPTFAIGLAHAAWAYERQDTFGQGMTDAERRRALELAEAALQSDPGDPLVQAISALVLLSIGGEPQRSVAMLEQAVSLCPHNATVLSLHAFANVMVGDVEAGRRGYLHALRISPGALDNYELLVGVAIAHLFLGEFEESITWSMRSLAQNPDWLGAWWTLAAAQSAAGRMGEARNTVARIMVRAPAMRMADIERLGRRYTERFRLIVDGLRKAGLPD